MLGAAARGRTSRVTKPAAIAAGNTHRRHWAASARPGGPGEDVRIVVLLLRTRRHAGQDLADLMAGLARPEADRPGLRGPGARTGAVVSLSTTNTHRRCGRF